jgi:hypothetical protein
MEELDTSFFYYFFSSAYADFFFGIKPRLPTLMVGRVMKPGEVPFIAFVELSVFFASVCLRFSPLVVCCRKVSSGRLLLGVYIFIWAFSSFGFK